MKHFENLTIDMKYNPLHCDFSAILRLPDQEKVQCAFIGYDKHPVRARKKVRSFLKFQRWSTRKLVVNYEVLA